MNRVQGKAWILTLSSSGNGSQLVATSYTGIFKLETFYDVLYHMKVSLVVIQSDTEYDTSKPLVNVIMEVSSRVQESSDVMTEYVNIGPVKIDFDPTLTLTSMVAYFHDTIRNDSSLVMYLNSMSEIRGGMSNTTTSFPDCTSKSTISKPDGAHAYCISCSINSIPDWTNGICLPFNTSTGRNTSCASYSTLQDCMYCPSNNYFYSLTEDTCVSSAVACPTSHVSRTPYMLVNQIDEACSDNKYFNTSSNCYFYSQAVIGAS